MPAWSVDLPRFRLFDGPSPLERLPRFSAELGGKVEIWIKREDLLPLAFGGNKIRNLEFLIGAARAAGADILVTSGRRWSNHCRLTAAAGAKAGLDVHLVLSGPPIDPPGPGVRIARLLGATVDQLPTADRTEREAAVARVVADLHGAGRRPYLIDVGGSGPVGAVGQVLAGLELAEQTAGLGLERAAIVLPSATGGTHAGLIVANGFAPVAGMILGVVVARPEAELRPATESLVGQLEALAERAGPGAGALAERAGGPGSLTGLTRRAIDRGGRAVHLDPTQLGDGYGRVTVAATAAAGLLARTEGILVDPIYTAKALAALIERVRAGRWDGRAIVFWHAGGTLGLFEPLDR